MLTQKLNVDDLQFEKGTFDGTMAYAQNKVKDTDLPQLDTRELNKRTLLWHVCMFVEGFLFLLFSLWQRQQVILTERWASQHKEIHFSSMHPGWADTPGKRKERLNAMYLYSVWTVRSSRFSLYLPDTTFTRPDKQFVFSLCSCQDIHAYIPR